MQKPKHPRAPKKPKKPSKYTEDFIRLGSRSSYYKTANLADFVEKIKILVAKKTNREVKSITLDEIYFTEYSMKLLAVVGTPNPTYEAEMKKYTEKTFPKYKKTMERYRKRLKVYQINKEVWDAWQLKQEEDRLLNQLKDIEVSLKEIEERRRVRVDSRE